MKEKKTTRNITFALILLVAGMVYLINHFLAPPMPKHISIATGTKDGMYYHYALRYKELFEQEGVSLEIIPTAGSVEALKLLEEGKVTFSFMQGGTKTGDTSALQSLASIYYEPIWVFYPQKHTLNQLSDLQGKVVAIGEEGSGTNVIAKKILHENHVDANNSTFISLKTNEEIIKALKRGYIDAMFISMSVSSPLIHELIKSSYVNVYPFMQSVAYQKKYPYLSPITLYPGVIDIAENVPMLALPLIASTASIVTHKKTHKKLIRLFMSKLKEIHAKEGVFTSSGQFPSVKGVDLPMNKYAKRYLESGDTWLEKTFPFWLANHLDRLLLFLIPLLTLMIPLIKGIIPLYRWSTRSKIYKWYETLHAMNEKSYHLEDNTVLENDILALQTLKQEVTQEVDVPLSYMGEYYNLQLHIEHVISKLEEKRA